MRLDSTLHMWNLLGFEVEVGDVGGPAFAAL